MKLFVPPFFLFLLSNLSYGQISIVEGPLDVSQGLSYNHPQIEVLGDGVPGVIWTHKNDYLLYFSKYDAGGFTPPVQLNPSGTEVQSYNWSGPDLAIEGNNVYVAYKGFGYETGNVYLVKSTDNGTSWSDTVRIDNLSEGFAQYPDLAVLNDTVYVTFMDHDAGGINPQYVITRSTDGGASFEPEVDVTALIGDEACDCCQPEIVVNADYVIVFFRNNDADIRDIKAVISYDRGETFSTWFSVDDHFWDISSCPSTGPDARFLSDDIVLSTYRSKDGFDYFVYLNEYDISSSSAISTIKVYSESGTGSGLNYPQLSTDDGDLAIVWEELDQSGDVFLNVSSTGLAGIDSSNSLNVSNASSSQNKPDVALKDGVVHMVYADIAAPQGVKYVKAISPILTIKDKSEIEAYRIFPNPAVDFVRIVGEGTAGLSYSITDGMGRLCQKGSLESGEKISILGLASGLYFVRVHSGNSSDSKTLPLLIGQDR